ncbi:hypothetical protein SLE2022_356380 [Rubroshorea leprosula]
MEDADQDHLGLHRPPSLLSLAPFSPPSRRRLSSNYANPPQPIPLARRLAWVSLHGRLVNAEEASSAKAIGGCLSQEEAVAWELFTPMQRFLIVAVIGVAASQSKKNQTIWQLKRFVELRDQVLSSMQQKLDTLCGQLNNVKDQPGIREKIVESGAFGSESIKFVDCGCWFCDQHHEGFVGLVANPVKQTSVGDEMLQYKMNLPNKVEPEERRMSDLSDWAASSVTSVSDIQLNNLAIEQDIFNLKKECEDKDAIIKELSTLIQSSNVMGSKRISELEDIIRRKNVIITRLKKDMVVLEQKVMQLMRLQRPSSSSSNSNCWHLPVMTDNLLYDMDSTTSPSSSDSESSPKNQPQTAITNVQRSPKNQPQTAIVNVQEVPFHNADFLSTIEQISTPTKASNALPIPTGSRSKSRSVSPLKEIAMNHKSGILSSRQRPFSALGDRQRPLLALGDSRKSRKGTQSASKEATPNKRWV